MASHKRGFISWTPVAWPPSHLWQAHAPLPGALLSSAQGCSQAPSLGVSLHVDTHVAPSVPCPVLGSDGTELPMQWARAVSGVGAPQEPGA